MNKKYGKYQQQCVPNYDHVNPQTKLYSNKFTKQAFTSRLVHKVNCKNNPSYINSPPNKPNLSIKKLQSKKPIKTESHQHQDLKPVIFPLYFTNKKNHKQSLNKNHKQSLNKNQRQNTNKTQRQNPTNRIFSYNSCRKSSLTYRNRLLSPKILPINISATKKQRIFSANYRQRSKCKSQSKIKSNLNILEITFGRSQLFSQK